MTAYDRFTDMQLLAWLEAGGWCKSWSLYAREKARLLRMSRQGLCEYHRGTFFDGKVNRGWFLTEAGERALHEKASQS